MKAIADELENNKKIEKRIRNTLYGVIIALFIFSISTYGNVRVMSESVDELKTQTRIMRQNNVTYEQFILFNKTYELQIEALQAYLTGDAEQIKEINKKYSELRSAITSTKVSRGN